MSKTKTVTLSMETIKSYKKKKVGDTEEIYTIEDKELFYKDSPVKEEDVKALNKYSKEYVERGLKTSTVFAKDAFTANEDLETSRYVLPYQEDKVELVFNRDEDVYTVHVDHTVPHMSYSAELAKRTKALNKAMAED